MESYYKVVICYTEEESRQTFPIAYHMYKDKQDWVKEMVRVETQLSFQYDSCYSILFKTPEDETYMVLHTSEIDTELFISNFVTASGSLEQLIKEGRESHQNKLRSLAKSDITYP